MFRAPKRFKQIKGEKLIYGRQWAHCEIEFRSILWNANNWTANRIDFQRPNGGTQNFSPHAMSHRHARKQQNASIPFQRNLYNRSYIRTVICNNLKNEYSIAIKIGFRFPWVQHFHHRFIHFEYNPGSEQRSSPNVFFCAIAVVC